ncbi:MAG: outer membrane lipoprotein carrier protein LolA [Bradymonadaceae bacterium]
MATVAVFSLVWGSGGVGGWIDGDSVVRESHAQDKKGDDGEAESTPAPGEMTAEDVARRVQRFYKKTEDFHAEFKQVYTDIAAGDEKVNYGKVYFKKPGKMRWDYYKAEDLENRKKTLVSDGKVFWVYELEFQQVFKRCLNSSQLPTSLKFLMGQGNLLEDFDVSFAEDSSEKAPELELVPKEPTPKYKKVHFQVDPETFQVDKTTVFDPYGNTNEIDFQQTKLNKNLPDSGFTFEPPEGARMLNPEKECSS